MCINSSLSSNTSDISTYMEWSPSIEHELEHAITQDSSYSLDQVIRDPRFHTITEAALGKAIRLGIEHNHLDRVELLFQSKRFSEIYQRQESHHVLFRLASNLGYLPDQPPGLCRGVGMMGIRAALISDITSFDIRIAKLIGLWLEHNKNLQDVTESLIKNPQFLLDFESFMNGICIWLYPQLFPHLFPKETPPIYQRDPLLVSPTLSLLHPYADQEESCEIATEAYVYNKQELTLYLETLRDLLHSSSITSPIGLYLSSLGHGIAIVYCPENCHWLFIDANNLPIKVVDSENSLVLKIFEGFTNENVDISNIIIWQQLFGIKKDAEILKKILEADSSRTRLNQAHAITPEKLQFIDGTGLTWLSRAIETGPLLVKKLMNAGASANEVNKKSPPPLHLAIACHNLEIIGLLLDHKADVNALCDGASPIAQALTQKTIPIANLLLSYGANLNTPLESGETVLGRAIASKNIFELTFLLKNNVDLNALSSGAPPITIPLDNGNMLIAKFLVEKGANVNTRLGSGETLLGRAIRNHDIPQINFLLEHGADPNALSWGWHPIQIAEFFKLQELVNVLISHGATIPDAEINPLI